MPRPHTANRPEVERRRQIDQRVGERVEAVRVARRRRASRLAREARQVRRHDEVRLGQRQERSSVPLSGAWLVRKSWTKRTGGPSPASVKRIRAPCAVISRGMTSRALALGPREGGSSEGVEASLTGTGGNTGATECKEAPPAAAKHVEPRPGFAREPSWKIRPPLRAIDGVQYCWPSMTTKPQGAWVKWMTAALPAAFAGVRDRSGHVRPFDFDHVARLERDFVRQAGRIT